MYADDTKILKRIDTVNDCENLQADLNHVSNWCATWKLTLNLSKCFCVIFSLKKNVPFNFSTLSQTHRLTPFTNEIKDLGVYFTSNLNFYTHINHAVKTAFRMLGFIKCVTKPIKDTTVLIMRYNAFVRSRIDYSSIWEPLRHLF